MVLFRIENLRQSFLRVSPNNTKPCLVIITNEITNEILKSIDTENIKNIVFRAPTHGILSDTGRNIKFDFTADIWTWNTFVRKIKHLEFEGKLVKNQLNAQHFECMLSMQSLYIGSTDYALFDNEDISKLPMISYILLNGYGLVLRSENMEKWFEKLKMNDCIYEECY